MSIADSPAPRNPIQRIPRTCETCGATFAAKPSEVARGRGRFCSRACKSNRAIIACAMCGAPVDIAGSLVGTRRFCSRACYACWRSETVRADQHPRWKGPIQRTCEQCGAAFTVNSVQVIERGSGRFCSRACLARWQSEHQRGENSPTWKGGPVARACEHCGAAFTVNVATVAAGGGRFCSQACHGRWQALHKTGPNSQNWRGGLSFEPYPTTFNLEFKRRIRERDGYTCALCGAPDSNCVHHINYVKQDTVPENCVTLCRPCHTKTNANRAHWQAFFENYMQRRGAR